MKIKKTSFAIGSVSLLLGIFLTRVLPKSTRMLSETEIPLPAFTQLVTSIPPGGWLIIFAFLGITFIIKDFFVSSKWFNVGAILLLGFIFIAIVVAVFLPQSIFVQKLEHH